MAVDIGLYISGSITVAAGVGVQRTINFFSQKNRPSANRTRALRVP